MKRALIQCWSETMTFPFGTYAMSWSRSQLFKRKISNLIREAINEVETNPKHLRDVLWDLIKSGSKAPVLNALVRKRLVPMYASLRKEDTKLTFLATLKWAAFEWEWPYLYDLGRELGVEFLVFPPDKHFGP